MTYDQAVQEIARHYNLTIELAQRRYRTVIQFIEGQFGIGACALEGQTCPAPDLVLDHCKEIF